MLVVAALVAAVGIVWAVHIFTPGRCGSSGGSYGMDEVGGECIGVTDGSVLLNPALRNVQHDIWALNKTLKPGTYVTVALLTPLTVAGPDDLVSLERIQNQLEGAYAAQFAADSSDFADIRPRIKLVLASEGSQEQGWQKVTDQLKSMVGGPDHLVAVTGMGISVTQTVEGAKALSAAGIPMVESVPTYDHLNWSEIPGLVRVMPNNRSQVTELRKYLVEHGEMRRAILVADNSRTDLYTTNLSSDYKAIFGSQGWQQFPYGPAAQAGNQFSLISGDVCSAGSVPPIIIYAGRVVLLPTLLRQLKTAPYCNDKKLIVVTGSDAAALPATVTDTTPGDAQVTVIYSSLTDPSWVTADARKIFTASGLRSDAGLSGTWTIATYNAVTAAWTAIRMAAGRSGSLPATSSVKSTLQLLKGRNRVNGATGPFAIGAYGNPLSTTVPVFRLTGGLPAQLVSP